jgi:Predicted methyltransferases
MRRRAPLQVARELTKRHEEQVGPTISAALEHFRRHPPQGECTLVLGGAAPQEQPERDATAWRQDLEALIRAGMSANAAAKHLASRSGRSKRELYALLHHTAEAADWPEPDGT